VRKKKGFLFLKVPMKLKPLHPLQIKRFREMSIREKWAVSQGLYRMAKKARLRVARRNYPALNEDACCALVAKEFARA